MSDLFDPAGGRLPENIVHFGRVLRRAGIPVGPRDCLDAVAAVEAAGFARREDFYWALNAVFVRKRGHREIFDQAFHVFWRKPAFLDQMMAMMMPEIAESVSRKPDPGRTRLAQALFDDMPDMRQEKREEPDVEVDATMTFSDREVFRQMDFEQMTRAEQDDAKAAIRRMRLRRPDLVTRRFRSEPHGAYLDMRATVRAAMRNGGEFGKLLRRGRRRKIPPLVVLCDISGSMSGYSRILLHFLHAVTMDGHHVHSFVFGTRLTNITRQLRARDVDAAVDAVSSDVTDWSGGTRIGTCLADFNRSWSRRVLGQGAHVLLITDGLDREEDGALEFEISRLHLSCRKLIWLNPLLRYDGFEARASGIRAMLPHVDEFRPVHNLESLEALASALTDTRPADHNPKSWLGEAA